MSGAEPSTGNLSGRVIRSGLWVVALSVTARLVGMARLFILARLLTPYDFGLVGIALVVILFLESFSALGTQQVLIQRGERARELFDTAWTLALIRGACVTGAVLLGAPAVGMFFGSPDSVAVVRAMAVMPLVNALSNVGMVEFRKELTLGPQYLLSVTGILADVCVAVPLALWGASAWALVAGFLALAVARTVMSYVLHPYRPVLRLDRREVREILGYGRWVSGTTAIAWLNANGPHAAVGRLLGVPALGVYQMASRIAALPTAEIAIAVSGVTVAAYAKLQDSTARVRSAYRRVLMAVTLGAAPVAVGIAIYGEALVRLVLGERWDGVVPLVHVLAVAGFLRSTAATTGPLFQGLDRPRFQTFAALVELVPLAALVVPFTLWMGPKGTALAAAIGAACGAAVSLTVVGRQLGIRGAELVTVLGWPPLACVPFVLLRVWLGPLDGLVPLAGAIVASAALYLAALVVLDRLDLYDIRRVVPPGPGRWLLRRRPAGPAVTRPISGGPDQ